MSDTFQGESYERLQGCLQGQPDINCEVKTLQEFLKIAIPLIYVKNLASLKVKGENNEALPNSYGFSLLTFSFGYGRRNTY